MYTIGQVAEMFDLPISTLRYYDKQGLFPHLTRESGIRKFSENEIEAKRKETNEFLKFLQTSTGENVYLEYIFE